MSAASLAIEARTSDEMRIGKKQITGVVNPTQDHQVTNKLYVYKNILMKNFVP